MTDLPSASERDVELEGLRSRLAEAEDVLRAIHAGEVDAFVVTGEHGEHVYALQGAYRQLTETMSEGVATLSADGTILYCNIRLLELLGRSIEQVVGSALLDYLGSVDQEALDAMLVQARTEPIRREVNLKARGGLTVPVYLSASCVPNEEADMAFCLVFTDLSEQKHHEQIECVARFPSENPNPVLRLSFQGVVQYANKAAGALLPMMGASVGGVVNAEWQAHIDAVVAEAHPINVDFQAGDRAFAATLAPIIEHGYVNLYGRDITERKRVDGELLEAKALVEAVVENIPLMIFLKEATDLRFVIFNRAGEELLGYDRGTFLGKNNLDLFPPEQAAHFMAKDREVLDGEAGMLDIPEEPIMTARKGQRLLHTRKVCIRGADGETKFLLGISEDITEQKRAEAEHEKLQSQFLQAQKMESVGRLAGGVAHDFNNLLMGIMNYVELCRDKVGLDHPIREWLDEITRDAQRSADVTGQLLAFARKQIIASKVLDLNDAVEGMLKLLRRLIGEDVNLAWEPGANVHPILIDPSQVDQLLANLCVNARDAIGGVGKITLETGNVTIGSDYCCEHAEAIPGAYVYLAVSDDGCGMDQATLAQIFEPFFTTKGIGQGTGLGLATVYGIVKQNNGFIYAYSEPGRGTTFKIYLPQAAVEAAAASGTAEVEVPRGHGETILLVEDEKSLRVTCALFLEALGYHVLKAETPGEALKTVAGHPGDIHLLLTDVVLPGMDGRQLSERVGAVKPGTKVLYMSGYTADVIAQRGVLEENVAFIGKPFSRDDLAHKVREVLGAPGSSPD